MTEINDRTEDQYSPALGYSEAMLVYAGIDEAGYGPLLGPLLVGRAVLSLPEHDSQAPLPDLWRALAGAICKDRAGGKQRIPVNDSKKLHASATGKGHPLRYLEPGVLAFASCIWSEPTDLGRWLDHLGESTHRDLSALPWYEPTADHPWETMPLAISPDQLAILRNQLRTALLHAKVQMLDLGAAVVFEDRFNRMVAATRSKAATSFTFVAGHLRHVWDRWGQHHPVAAVDRQSGRSHYRELLAMTFPEAMIQVLQEDDACSRYRLTGAGTQGSGRGMTVSFQVEAEAEHLPVALASMVSKYTREALMNRLNRWFNQRVPQVAPTAGYALDGKRFLREIHPHLPRLGVDASRLCRQA